VPGTKEGFWQVVIATRAAFPDVHVVPEDMLAEGDRVMFRDTVMEIGGLPGGVEVGA
jgi:predicted ester cyclase